MADLVKPTGSRHAGAWTLDPDVVFLNHGSFGACPRSVLELQTELRARLERQPLDFFLRHAQALVDEARHVLAAFVGADPDGIAFVVNATTGVNAVLRSFELGPGDEILVLDHAYGACRNAVQYVCDRAGARVVRARVPFPLERSSDAVDAVRDAITDRTVLAMIDHITSPTGLVLPIAELVSALSARGVDALVDGAHAPGQVALDLEALGAAYYTGNCHKWLCTPKGSAFLYVRRDRRDTVRPLVISHGAGAAPPGRFRHEFDWQGTDDPTSWLCIPAAIRFLSGLMEGGWPALAERNRRLALQARDLICRAVDASPPAPAECIAMLAAVPLPDTDEPAPEGHFDRSALQLRLADHWGIEVPIVHWPTARKRLVRVSAQAYNSIEQFEWLARALRAEAPHDGG